MINRKKYKKIVGSCIVMSFMVFALLFYVKDTEATDNEIVYAPNYIYTASKYVVNGEKIAPSAPSEISGYLFAGWYTLPEGSTTYTPVAEPKENETYYAKFVPQEILGVKAQVTAALIKDEATSKTANSAIRFITTVDSNLYQEVGFNIDRPGKSTPYDTGNGVVYKELYAVDATRENKGEPDTTYTPDMFHKQSEYFKTWTIGKIPKTYYDSDITVRPYWITLDGTRVDGEIAVKTVNYGRSWYYVDAVAESTNTAAPEGTASNPYETLAAAVAVETRLDPKIILKSDVTVDATVNIARTVTIESFDGAEAKTITYSGDTTKNMLEVTEKSNLTLNKLDLNGGNYVVNSTNATFVANNVNIQDGGFYGFRIVGGTANLNNVEITGVDRGVRLESGAIVTGETLNIFSPKQGISCDGGSTFDYKDLNIDGNTNHAINVFANSTVKVNGGEITNAKGNGLNVGGAKAATLTGVDITFATAATGGYGVNAYSEKGVVPKVTLENVDIMGAPEHSIYISAQAQVVFDGDVNIQGASSGNYDCLYVTDASSIATINGTLTTTGGRYGLAVFKGGKVIKGENYSKITINSSRNHGAVVMNNSEFNVGEMALMSCGGNGILMQYDSPTVTLDGTVNIDSVTKRGVEVIAGTLKAKDATIKIHSSGTYGLSINTSGEIGDLEITDAGEKTGTGFSAALQLSSSASLTLYKVTITDSYRHGINMNSTGTLSIKSGTITNSGRGTSGYFDIRKENTSATMDIDESVLYYTGWNK